MNQKPGFSENFGIKTETWASNPVSRVSENVGIKGIRTETWASNPVSDSHYSQGLT